MSNIVHDLLTESSAAKVLLQQMATIVADDEELVDTIIEGETDVKEALGEALKRHIDLNILIEGCKAQEDKIRKRRQRFEQQQELLKTAMQMAMTDSQMSKLEHELATLSLRKVPPSVEIEKEEDIPASYWIKQEPKLDKRQILADLKNKKPVAGCTLSPEGMTLAIREK